MRYYHVVERGWARLQDLKLEATDTLEQALQKADDLPFASTDCSLPMTYATSRGLKVGPPVPSQSPAAICPGPSHEILYVDAVATCIAVKSCNSNWEVSSCVLHSVQRCCEGM